MSKYGAVKTTVDGIVFDSKKEANYYCELKMLQMAGEIKDFELQPEFVLQDSFKHLGKKIRPIVYRADFKVTDATGQIYYVDTKGFKTKEYMMKKKMLLFQNTGIDFREE